MATKGDFENWQEVNPAPDLRALAAEFGDFHKILAERYAQWRADYEDWLGRYRNRHNDEARLG
jgi:hypothetical protein